MARITVRKITDPRSSNLGVKLSDDEKAQVLRYAKRFANALQFVDGPEDQNIDASIISDTFNDVIEGIRLHVGRGVTYDLSIIVVNNARFPNPNPREIAAEADIRFGDTPTLSFSLQQALEVEEEETFAHPC